MSNLGEGLLERGRQEGLEEGIETGIIQTTRALVKHCGLSVDDVLNSLDLSEEKRALYKQEILKA